MALHMLEHGLGASNGSITILTHPRGCVNFYYGLMEQLTWLK